MYVLDANVFTRTVHPSQPEYDACTGLITELSIRRIAMIIPPITLTEVAGSVRRETNDAMRARIFVDVVRGLPTIQIEALDDVLTQAAVEIAADYVLRGMDAIYVAVAQRYGCTLVTLDEEARIRASRVVTAVTPAQALAGL